MSTANPIETNVVDNAGVSTTAQVNSVGKFSSVLDAASYAASIAGPAGYYTAAEYAPSSADIVGAAVNSTASYGGGTGYSTTPGVYSGATSNYYGSSSTLGLSASGSLGYSTTGSSSDDMLAMAQEQLAASQTSSIAMLMVQDEMGMQNRLYTSASNLMNSRDTMLATIIRNVRVG